MQMDNIQTDIRFIKVLTDVGVDGWMMSLEERLVVCGLLAATGCRSILELGYGKGGCTRWLSGVCESVVTVDLDPSVNDASRMANVEPMQMTTQEALEQLAASGRRFDVAIIDAGHDAENVRSDILGAAKVADVLILHDIFYPPTRRGAIRAVGQLRCWHNFDVVAGYFKDGALWGGIGLVCLKAPAVEASLKSSTLGGEYLRRLFEVKKQVRFSRVPQWVIRFSRLMIKVWRDATTPL